MLACALQVEHFLGCMCRRWCCGSAHNQVVRWTSSRRAWTSWPPQRRGWRRASPTFRRHRCIGLACVNARNIVPARGIQRSMLTHRALLELVFGCAAGSAAEGSGHPARARRPCAAAGGEVQSARQVRLAHCIDNVSGTEGDTWRRRAQCRIVCSFACTLLLYQNWL